jgi:sialate O-acetylesterase
MSPLKLNRRVLRLCCLIILLRAAGPVFAELRLPSIISDHMVLARDEKSHVWGWAKPGEAVTVSFNGSDVNAAADATGRWEASLDLRSAPAGPGDLQIKTPSEQKVIHDVLVGEVWLASGQSNMEFTMAKVVGAPAEIAASANANLRQYRVRNARSLQPLDDTPGYWNIAGPKTTAGFSAVAYYFAKRLQSELNTPVAIIDSSWGGTPIEAWMDAASMEKDPLLKVGKQRVMEDIATFPQRFEAYKQAYQAWTQRYNREDHPDADTAKFTGSNADANETHLMLPGEVAGGQLPRGGGAVWLQKTVKIPGKIAAQDMNIDLGSIRGFVTVYWNGEKIGQIAPNEPSVLDKRFVVPAKLVKPGAQSLAVRLFSPAGPGAVDLDGVWFHAGSEALKGEWQATTEFSLPVLSAAAVAEYPVRPNQPPELHQVATGLFNAMINPNREYAIRGVIWYQGEQNTDHSWQYGTELPLMIEGWRSVFDRPSLPFYVVQLPNYFGKSKVPSESKWAEMRDAQLSALALANTGVAVTIDLGDSGDIHPCRKVQVGERLARLALAKDYGKQMAYSGPVYKSIKIEGDTARLRFEINGQTLAAASLPATYSIRSAANETAPLVRNTPDSELEGFSICGANHKWVWADAKIDGSDVICRSASVPAPVAVRYAWADNPTCNLTNDSGLPASPFRTDDFPLLTQSLGYYGVNAETAKK